MRTVSWKRDMTAKKIIKRKLMFNFMDYPSKNIFLIEEEGNIKKEIRKEKHMPKAKYNRSVEKKQMAFEIQNFFVA